MVELTKQKYVYEKTGHKSSIRPSIRIHLSIGIKSRILKFFYAPSFGKKIHIFFILILLPSLNYNVRVPRSMITLLQCILNQCVCFFWMSQLLIVQMLFFSLMSTKMITNCMYVDDVLFLIDWPSFNFKAVDNWCSCNKIIFNYLNQDFHSNITYWFLTANEVAKQSWYTPEPIKRVEYSIF